jgi:hypothetical protein
MADEQDNADDGWENEEMESEEEYDDDDDISEGDGMNESGEGSDEEDTIDDVIVEQFIRTFHNGGYDTELDNALCYERGIIPPAHPTQASYNKPDNWRERNRIGLEKIQMQLLQRCIDSDSVKHGESFNLFLNHNQHWQQLMDGEEPIVWHEQILDEYWHRLEATDIKCMYIENIEITKKRLATLVTTLSGQVSKIEDIYFINVNLCEESIISISKLVDISSNLQILIIHHNRIDNMESAHCLSSSLKSHACIHTLHLSHCDLGSSPEILSVILQSDVKRIGLSSNSIDSLGAVKIAEYLEGDPPIHQIDLAHNRLNDDDAVLISLALIRNTNLKTINLHSNNFTSIGVKALLTCVFDSSSLNSISESNHKLKEISLFDDDNRHIQRLDSCIDRLLELDRAEKIMFVLQDKDSLLQYLANVPVELIPEVLAFPLRRDGNQHQHKHLNIVYSTMRWWNMPMLYSYLN